MKKLLLLTTVGLASCGPILETPEERAAYQVVTARMAIEVCEDFGTYETKENFEAELARIEEHAADLGITESDLITANARVRAVYFLGGQITDESETCTALLAATRGFDIVGT